MNKHLSSLCVLLFSALMITSCLGDGDDNDVSLYGDTAITSFSLSTVNRYLHTTTSEGEDSIYKVTVSSGLPVFTIDQYSQQIYNTAPLPTGTDLQHVLATIGSKNGGVVLLKSLTSDTLSYYSSSDSIDFSYPREIRVYAQDGSDYRAYNVVLSVRTTEPNVMVWTEVDSQSPRLPASLSQQVAVTPVDENTFLLSSDGGASWSEQRIKTGETSALLPAKGLAWVSFPFNQIAGVTCQLLAGALDGETEKVTFWRELSETSDDDAQTGWVYMPVQANNPYFLPLSDGLSLVWFNGCLYALSNTASVYKSVDKGLSWRQSSDLALPEELQGSHVVAATDDEGQLWVADTETGRVWCGVLTK